MVSLLETPFPYVPELNHKPRTDLKKFQSTTADKTRRTKHRKQKKNTNAELVNKAQTYEKKKKKKQKQNPPDFSLTTKKTQKRQHRSL
jgi:hypothetical protein